MRLNQVLWAAGVVGLLLVMVPAIDLTVSGWFQGPHGFVWRAQPWANFLHEAIQILARVMGVVLLGGFAYTSIRLCRLWGLRSRQWLFLLLALLIGPGLLTNTILKDNWGRARPVMIQEFGGHARFTPPLVITDQCRNNCSFVAGDPALTFYLHSFAYVMPIRRRRIMLAAGMGAGLLGGLLRIAMGAHFFSDVLFAGALIIATSALLHAVLFGRIDTRRWWHDTLSPQPC